MKHRLKYINHALLATLLATKTSIAHFSHMVGSNLFALHFTFLLIIDFSELTFKEAVVFVLFITFIGYR